MRFSLHRDRSIIREWADSLLALAFPKLCACCSMLLVEGEDTICTTCRYDMPLTGYYNRKDNVVVERFAGRVIFENASTLMFFQKNSHYRDLLHRMKYSGRSDIAITLGKIYGAYLKESGLYGAIDTIIPVPLHFSKRLKRGYNQSAEFAKGIALSLGVKVEHRAIRRNRRTKTQARQGSIEHRQSNVEGAFSIRNKNLLLGKTVLLVDDIITSGATLEACADTINRNFPEIQLSLGAIAFVK